jgi:hypothetical protein
VNHTKRLAALSLLSALVAASCGGGSNSGGAPSPSPAPAPAPGGPSGTLANPGQLLPSTVNPAVAADATEFHVVIPPAPGSTAQHKLFVFLPGTLGVPSQYELIVKAGASRGFHTIGLDYPNSVAVGAVCQTSTDVNCFYDVRRAIITGAPVSPDITVSVPNSIETRLTEAIMYLDSHYSTEGWNDYLIGGVALDWSKVVIGGHSQGGGHAGVMTKLHAMHRACYFSSPPDYSGGPANWMTIPSKTPATPQYGFAGLSDPSVPYNELSANFTALGLAGPAVSVDSNVPPYSGSHVLTTGHAPNPSSDPGTPLHGLTVRDTFTPRDSSGQPLFAPAWDYLCFQ